MLKYTALGLWARRALNALLIAHLENAGTGTLAELGQLFNPASMENGELVALLSRFDDWVQQSRRRSYPDIRSDLIRVLTMNLRSHVIDFSESRQARFATLLENSLKD
jgi:hypothetical protein